MSDPGDEIRRAFEEASRLNRPLQDRLDLLSAKRRAAQAVYDRLVARLAGNRSAWYHPVRNLMRMWR